MIMKVNRQVISQCRSLPPNVEGELNGALTMQVDEILWCKKIYTNVIVCVQWWGEQEPMKFRPLRCKHRIDDGLSVVFTYRIHAAPQFFYSYLEDSEKLSFVVIDESTRSRVGCASLHNLREAFIEQCTKQISLPVVDGEGVKVAELCLSLTLKFFEDIRVSKVLSAEGAVSAPKCPAPQASSEPRRGVPDSLVAQLLQQAQRLRDAMAESVLQDWEETDIRQHYPQCHHASVFSQENMLTDLLGNSDDIGQPEAMEVLDDLCPSTELLNLVASLGGSAKHLECGSKEQQKFEEKKQSEEVKECLTVKPAFHDEQQASTDSVVDEFLAMAVTIRVCVSSLCLESVPRSSTAYFVNYEVPKCLVTDHSPLSRTTCSRRLTGRVVQFAQRFVHTLSKQGASLAGMLRNECLVFKVYCRHLSDRKRSFLGQVTMSLADLSKAERLEVQQDLIVPGIGELNVMVQLGCDKVQFGHQMLVKRRQPSQSCRTTSRDGGPLSSSVEKGCLQEGGQEQNSQPYIATATALREPHPSSQHQLLYALLHVPCGRLTTPSNSYLVCRAFWRDHVLTSDVARDGCNPRYNLHQVLPMLLSPELLERCQDNILVLEVWESTPGADLDTLIGLAKVLLHPFYLAYKDPIIVSQLLLAKCPVVSADRWVQVVCPSSGSVQGELRVLLALGSEEQVLSLGATSGSMLGPAGDCCTAPAKLQQASRHVQHFNAVDGASGTVSPSKNPLDSERGIQELQKCTGSDRSHNLISQNAVQAKDIRPLQSNKAEFVSSQVNSARYRHNQNEVRRSVNFSASCRNETWKKKNKGSNQSKSLHSCECTTKGMIPSAQSNVQRTFEKSADTHSDVHLHHNNVPTPHDVTTRGHGRLQCLSSKAREKETCVVQDCDASDICSSNCTSNSVELTEPRKKQGSLPASAACIPEGQDVVPDSSSHFSANISTVLSDLQRNLMMLNLAGGDTLHLERLAVLRQQSSLPDPVLTYENGQAKQREKQLRDDAVEDHSSGNCSSPGHSTDTRFTNIESFCDFSGEVGGSNSVAAGCNSENKTVSEKSTAHVSGSTSTAQEDDGCESFSARVKVEQAVHLTLKVPCRSSDEPKVYVTFQASGSGLHPLVSPSVKAGESAVWGWSCDTQLAVHLLSKEEKCLVLKVWQAAGDDTKAAADSVLGFAVVDLTSLLRGFSFVSGWYSLVDYAGCCVGQIKVTVVPLEDLSRFVDFIPQMELPVQESYDSSGSDLYSNLKEKLSELDEITARLRQRLDTVVSDERIFHAPPTNASTRVMELDNDPVSADNEKRTMEDKCIQTSACDEDSDAWTDWLMGVTIRDLELESVFNPLLLQPLISSCIEPSALQKGLEQSARAAYTSAKNAADSETSASPVASYGSVSRSQTVVERLQTLWKSSHDLARTVPRQAPDGVSAAGNSTSVSQLSVLEEMKASKT